MYEFKKIFKRSNRLIALLLSCFLSFGIVSTEYLEVQAFEWVAPTLYLPFVDAMPYLMGLLGVSPSNDDSINWDSWRDDYVEYAESGGLSNEALREWMEEVSNGRLNQVSECWLKFKEWVQSLSQSSAIGGTIGYLIQSIPYEGTNINLGLYSNVILEEGKFLCYYGVSNDYVRSLQIITFPDYVNVSTRVISGQLFIYFSTTSGSKWLNDGDYINFYALTSNNSLSLVSRNSTDYGANLPLQFNGYDISQYFLAPSSLILQGTTYSLNPWNVSSEPTNNIVVTLDSSIIQNLSLVLSDAISSAIPDVIPLPWDQIGGTADEITDTIDGLIEQVNTGVISISAYMQAILDLVGAIAVDTTTDLVYPQNPDKPDETIDDKTDSNKDNMGFTLLGLEKVFPFCIPFDIYAFMTLLVAEPVAPVINWPVYNPITQQNEIITIDFSTWNSVVVLFRYIFDFLFIIGMLLMARALIGGGDSA